MTTTPHHQHPAQQVLSALPTASISDALDRLSLPGSLHGISPLRPGQRACGPAYTVAFEPVDEHGGTVGDFLDDVPTGGIVVIDNQARTDCTVWGGIMTLVAAATGIAGTVINGVCRDVEAILSTSYPMWSTGRFMRTGKDRVRVAALQQPLTIDGVIIRPGDLVCADEDGALVVPAERAEEVAELATRIEAVEKVIVAAAQSGMTLTDARAAHGYHTLQTAPQEATR